MCAVLQYNKMSKQTWRKLKELGAADLQALQYSEYLSAVCSGCPMQVTHKWFVSRKFVSDSSLLLSCYTLHHALNMHYGGELSVCSICMPLLSNTNLLDLCKSLILTKLVEASPSRQSHRKSWHSSAPSVEPQGQHRSFEVIVCTHSSCVFQPCS
jgi:hypothetical protein